ncbi:MAG: hypothetical protein HFH45_03850, partial [Bacilli bacterium]|nr:hypothetical protein [Bacilli bacterium]
ITLSDSNNPAIKFTSSGLEEGSELNAGDSAVLTVKVEYDSNVTSQPESTEGTFTVTLDYSQKDGASGTPGGETAADKLIATETTSGDGLYADDTEIGRYIYKGTTPSNYITFNNETWRIMSVESDGTLKIIRDTSIGNIAWDTAGTRDKSTSTYCTTASSSGCNAWAATSNLVNPPSDFTLHYPNGNPTIDTTTYSGTVTKDASLNTYLNTTYLGTIKEDSKYIVNHNFNVGTPGNTTDTEDIATDVSQEALYKWNGKIGLMNVTDVLKTTTNTTCTSLKVGYDSDSTGYCNTNNWMWIKSGSEWTVSPYVFSNRGHVWRVLADGYVRNITANGTDLGVRPVLYLTSDIHLDGEGTQSNPYKVVS